MALFLKETLHADPDATDDSSGMTAQHRHPSLWCVASLSSLCDSSLSNYFKA